MCSRRICFPAVKGEAERLTMAWAPACGEDLDGVLVIAAAAPEIAVVPDVFADADAQAPAVQLEDLGAGGGLEIAVFVEDVVGGQEGFMKDRAGGAVLQQRGAVEQGAAPVAGIGGRDAHQQGRGVLQFGCEAPRALRRRGGRNPRFIRRSRGRYPIRASSGVTTRSAPWVPAARTPRTISAAFPFRSPAVGLIWSSAIRKTNPV